MSSLLLAMTLLTGVEATLVSLRGSVEVALPGTPYRSGKEGEVLGEGSRVRTGAQSEAMLRLDDGSTLKLRERGEMQVAAVKRPESTKTAMVLFFGRLWSKVTKSGSDHFDVVTPTTTAGVRGTEFTTAVADDGSTRVDVGEGSVAVDNEDEKATVGAGQGVESSGTDVSAPHKSTAGDWDKWSAEKRTNLQKNGETIARGQKAKIDKRRAEVERLSKRQKELKEEYREADEPRRAEIKRELQRNAERLGELGVRAASQFGQFEHWGELAEDPEFGAKFMGAGFVRSELKRMRAVRVDLERMIAEGTDIGGRLAEGSVDLSRTANESRGVADLFPR